MSVARALSGLVGLVLWCDVAPFDCEVKPPRKESPANVTELHPGHISVVIAMGDSVTAAFAARQYLPFPGLDLPLEFRGQSFSGGVGSDKFHTLPYFLRQFNSSLVGFSTGTTIPQTPSIGYVEKEVDSLNVALTNAHAFELGQQIDEILARGREVPGFDERWKVLTLFIGANDLCDGISTGFEACDGDAGHRQQLVSRMEGDVRQALSRLREAVPRVAVQVVSMFNMTSLVAARRGSPWCALRKGVLDECNCMDRSVGQLAQGTNVSDAQLREFDTTVAEFDERLQAVVRDFEPSAGFAVFSQTRTKGVQIPDISWVSNLDCFHPSEKAHAALAVGLWNGLFSASAREPTPLDKAVEPFCPQPDSVIDVAHVKPEAVRVVV